MTQQEEMRNRSKLYPDWEEPARLSKERKAVSHEKVSIIHEGRALNAEVVKPLHGDGILVYEGTGIAIRKATAREIDSRKNWKVF